MRRIKSHKEVASPAPDVEDARIATTI
jgi:hypothetical protein